MDFDKLRAPFPSDRVSWRVGSTNKDKTKGMALAYIDARDVADRLDQSCTPAGWQKRYPHAGAKTVCEIGIKIGDEWIWKADGAGDSDVEAEKGALSDAFKRAAVAWGIGRYLYDVDSPWVTIEPMGKSYKIADSERQRLQNILRGNQPKLQNQPLRPIPYKQGDWTPNIAKAFTDTFLGAARGLTVEGQQELYKLNEPAIEDLRGVSAKAAEYLDNKFAELT